MLSHMSDRVSDADRDRGIELVRTAVSDGRLDLAEMDARISAALAARTEDELAVVVGDLGVDAGRLTHREPVVIQGTHANFTRNGPWEVPDELVIRTKWSNITIDMREATFASPTCRVTLEVHGGSGTIVVPDDVMVFDDGVESYASTLTINRHEQPEHTRATLRLVGSLRYAHITASRTSRLKRWIQRRQQERKDPPRTR